MIGYQIHTSDTGLKILPQLDGQSQHIIHAYSIGYYFHWETHAAYKQAYTHIHPPNVYIRHNKALLKWLVKDTMNRNDKNIGE